MVFSRNGFQVFKRLGSNYLTWSAVRCAVPKHLRNLIVDRNVLNTLELKCGNKDFDPLSSKSRNFYAFSSFKKKPNIQEGSLN